MFGKPSFGKPPGVVYAGGTPNFNERPGQAQPIQQPSMGTKYGAYATPSSQTTGDPRGAYATAPPNQRPPPMQIAPAQTPWGQSMDPFAERDAFVRQIGNQRLNNQIAFNTSGPTAPQGSPAINYDMARQNAGLAGGAPSMNANPADTFIGRFNNQYGVPVNPGFGGGQSQQAYYPGGPGGFPTQPPQGTPYRQPPSQPQYGTPPERRGRPRTADWRDADKDRVDDRDQDGPGMPAYGRPGNAQPIAPQQPPTGYNPGMPAPAYNPPANDTARSYPRFDPQIHGYNPGMPARPALPVAGYPGDNRPLRPPPSQGAPPPAYNPPANGATRRDPHSGKMVTYENGQWSWEPNPISGPQPYDTSRFGDGTPPGPQPKAGQAQPIPSPSQGTAYQQPDDPYAVTDIESLPFYKSLRVGDKVRKREGGQHDVYDSSGVAVETYNPGSAEPSVSMKRTREPLFLYQNEGMTDQQLGDIQSQREKAAKQKKAGDAWIEGAPARLEKERDARRNSPLGRQAQANIDKMQAEVSSLERNLSKGSLSDKNAKLKRIRELKQQISTGAASYL